MQHEGEADGATAPLMPARAEARESLEDLDDVYHRHAGAISATVHRLVLDPHATQDVVQETFLRAWRRRETYDPSRSSLRAWLVMLARSCAIDHLRSRGARPWQKSLVPPELMPGEPVDEAYEAVLAAWVVEDELLSLPEPHRRVLVETHLRDRPYADVAAELGIPVGTVRSRVHHALHMMRRSLEREVDPS